MRLIVLGSIDVPGATRRAERIWCSRSGETVRKWADWPTSVLNMSARLEPSQSTLGSPEALRNGRIARERAGAEAVFADGGKSVPRNKNPAIASNSTVATPITSGQ